MVNVLNFVCFVLQVSYTFCKDFIAVLLKDMSSSGFGSTKALLKAFDRVSIYDWLEKNDIYHVIQCFIKVPVVD